MVTLPGMSLETQLVVSMEWDRGVESVRLVNLLLMPHFGRSKQVSTYVWQLLVCFYGGYLWIDKPYIVDVELISSITGLPHQGHDPAPYLCMNKDTMNMKEKYDLQHANRGFCISSITENIMRFAAKIFFCKLLRKLWPTECTHGTVKLVEQCVEGLVFN